VYFLDNAYEYTVKKARIVAFEEEAHKIIHSPGFEIDDISSLYLKKLKEQWGDEVHVPEYYKDEWLTVANIMCSPFEDFAYPFGYVIAINLHEQYKKKGAGFAQNIISIMSAGDEPIAEVLVEEAGMDIKSREFWQHGYDLVREKVDELKRLTGS
jgi:oligoendopeptidase F